MTARLVNMDNMSPPGMLTRHAKCITGPDYLDIPANNEAQNAYYKEEKVYLPSGQGENSRVKCCL